MGKNSRKQLSPNADSYELAIQATDLPSRRKREIIRLHQQMKNAPVVAMSTLSSHEAARIRGEGIRRKLRGETPLGVTRAEQEKIMVEEIKILKSKHR